MKSCVLIFLVGWFGLGSCKEDAIENFIPGTYCASWKTHFSEVRDTLCIRLAVTEGRSVYQVTRRMHIAYVREREPEYKIEHWTGAWDMDKQIMVIQSNGRVLSFDPRNKLLKMGITPYQKL